MGVKTVCFFYSAGAVAGRYRIAVPRRSVSIVVIMPRTETIFLSTETLITSSTAVLYFSCAISPKSLYKTPPNQKMPKIEICLPVAVTEPKISYLPSGGNDLSCAIGSCTETQPEKTTVTTSAIIRFNFINIPFPFVIDRKAACLEKGEITTKTLKEPASFFTLPGLSLADTVLLCLEGCIQLQSIYQKTKKH